MLSKLHRAGLVLLLLAAAATVASGQSRRRRQSTRQQLKQEVAAQTQTPPAQQTQKQQPQGQKKEEEEKVLLLSAKSAQLIEEKGQNYRKVVGPARFLHNNTYLLCDTALWNVTTNVIDAIGHVKIIQDRTQLSSATLQYVVEDNMAKFRGDLVQLEDKDKNTLRTRYLDYNTKDSVAVFQNGAAMRDKDGQVIESIYGTYDSKAHLFVFNDQVNMYMDTTFVKTSRLEYRSDLSTAYFGFNTDMWQDDKMLTANDGWYNREEELFFFRRNVHLLTQDQEAWADSLYYYRRFNNVDMLGKVELMDTTRNVFALAGHFQYTDSLSQVRMTREPAIMSITDEKGRMDTLYLGGDELVYRAIRRCDIPEGWIQASEKRLSDIGGDPVMEYRRKAAEAAAKAAEEAMKDDPNRPPDPAKGKGGDAAQKGGEKAPKGESAAPSKRGNDRKKEDKPDGKAPEGTEPPPVPPAQKDTLQAPSDSLAAPIDSLSVPADSLALPAPVDSLAFPADSLSVPLDSLSAPPAAPVDSLAAVTPPVVDTTAPETPEEAVAPAKEGPGKEVPEGDEAEKTDEAEEVAEPEVPKDTTKVNFFFGSKRVRLFRKDVQMASDSLAYSDLDSLILLYEDPVFFNEGNRQYASDSIYMVIHNQRMEKAHLLSNAFITIQEDAKSYDQIRGAEMVAYFDTTSTLVRFDALGGAATLFFLEENNALATVNKVEAKMIYATFKDGDIERMYYYDNPKNDGYPSVQLPQDDRTLKGFRWTPERRPASPRDVTSLEPRQSQRTSYLARPHAEFTQTNTYFPGYIKKVYRDIAIRDSLQVVRERERQRVRDSIARAEADSLALAALDSLTLPPPDSLAVPVDSLRVPTDSLKVHVDSLKVPTDSLRVPVDSLGVSGSGVKEPEELTPEQLKAMEEARRRAEKEAERKRKEAEKARKAAEKEKRRAEKQAAREAKWAEEDRVYEEKQAAKAQRKLEKERARKLKALRKLERRAQKERARFERYLRREQERAQKRKMKQ